MEGVNDRRYLAVLDDMSRELEANLREYNGRASGVVDKDELFRIREEQNDALAEMVRRHRRALRFHQGKPVEPEVQFGEGVLVGVFGGGAI